MVLQKNLHNISHNFNIFCKKSGSAGAEPLCVGVDLSSRTVSSQVLSAQMSLTSVFGMGTGGPSSIKTPTM